jgi:hypothetical protein
MRRILLSLAVCLWMGVTVASACTPSSLPLAGNRLPGRFHSAGGCCGSSGISLVVPPAQNLIPHLAIAPKLGDFLLLPNHSSVAAQMLRVPHFVERYPDDGGRPGDATTAYLGYTHDAFYAAFVCKDPDPKEVRAHMVARDSLGNDDKVTLYLDTFGDHRRAFVFQSNALGIQADALYSEQDGYDYSFDTVWDTWGRRTPYGFVVLMRIPFVSLYFAKARPDQLRRWGIILERDVASNGESDFWPRNRHDIAGKLTQERIVEGFQDIGHGQNMQLEPYALARNLRQLNSVNPLNPYFEDKHLQGYAGLDSKFILHNSLVLDTTLNPDFSQVGVDNPAAPNQRFPAYFPEVRPFFIENSSYFQTPINLYYTDNIARPQFGARLTGKAGPWALGLLGVDDRGPGEAVPPGNPEANTRAFNYLARIDRDIGKLSDVGVIYADRQYLGSYNRAGGFDYRARFRNRWTVTGQALTSQTDNRSNSTDGEQECENSSLYCSGQAYVQSLSYSALHNSWWINYDDTAAGFVTDTGFFRRPDVREAKGSYNYTFRPASGPVLSDGINFYSERMWDHHGTPLDFYFNPSYNINFKRQTSFNTWANFGQDRLRPIDYSQLSSDVEYHSHVAGASFYTSPVPYLGFSASYSGGTVINYSPPANQGPAPVDESQPSISLEIKALRAIDLQNSYSFTRFSTLNSGQTVYDNHQIVSRWNYQMTKAASLNLIGQYISTLPNERYTDASSSQSLFADALFTYMPHPGTAFYFGYIGNFDNYDRSLCTRLSDGLCNSSDPILPTNSPTLMNDGKTIYVKMTYLLRF